MNKISLISLALSFLFTIGSGFVSSTHSSEGDGSTVSSSDANTESNSNEQTQATTSESENTEPQKKSKKRRGTKGKVKARYRTKNGHSIDDRLTDENNAEVLHSNNSVTVNENKTN